MNKVLSFFTFSLTDYQPYISNQIYMVLPLKLLFLIQFGSLTPPTIWSENLKSIFHMGIYDGIIQQVRLQDFIASDKAYISWIVPCCLLIMLGVFLALQFQALRSKNFDYIRLPMKIVLSGMQIYWFIGLIPTMDLMVESFKCSSLGDCYEPNHWIRIFFSFASAICIIFIKQILYYFPRDLKYFSSDLSKMNDSNLEFFLPLLLFVAALLSNLARSYDVFVYIGCAYICLLAIWIYVDSIFYFHLIKNNLIFLLYYVLVTFLVWETVISLIHSFWYKMGSIIDVDLLTISIQFGVIRLSLGVREKFRQYILDQNIYTISSQVRILNYIKFIVILSLQAERQIESKFELFSIIGQHISTCQVLQCDCKIIKKTLVHSETEEKQEQKQITLDESVFIEATNRVGYTSSLQRKVDSITNYMISAEQSLVLKMTRSFFEITMRIKGDLVSSFFFFEYVMFLLSEEKNLLSSVILLGDFYNKRKKRMSFHERVMVHNLLLKTEMLISRKTNFSQEMFVRKHSLELFEYMRNLDILPERCSELCKNYNKFYEELLEGTIHLQRVRDVGIKIIKEREDILQTFKKMFATQKMNKELVALYINFQRRILFRHDNLAEFRELFYLLCSNTKKKEKMIEKKFQIKDLNEFFNSENHVVFSSVFGNTYAIERHTSNVPKLLHYTQMDLIGKPISCLMPLEVAKKHDKLLDEIIYSREMGKVHKKATVQSFMVRSDGVITPVCMHLKFEITGVNQVSGICLFRNIEKKHPVFILNDEGHIQHANQSASTLLPPETWQEQNRMSFIYQYIPVVALYLYDSRQAKDDECVKVAMEEHKNSGSKKDIEIVEEGSSESEEIYMEDGEEDDQQEAKPTKFKGVPALMFQSSDKLFFSDTNTKTKASPIQKALKGLSENKKRIIMNSSKLLKVHFDLSHVEYFEGQIRFWVLELRSIFNVNDSIRLYLQILCKIRGELSGAYNPFYAHPDTLYEHYFSLRKTYTAMSSNFMDPTNSDEEEEEPKGPSNLRNIGKLTENTEEIKLMKFLTSPSDRKPKEKPRNASSSSSEDGNQDVAHSDNDSEEVEKKNLESGRGVSMHFKHEDLKEIRGRDNSALEIESAEIEEMEEGESTKQKISWKESEVKQFGQLFITKKSHLVAESSGKELTSMNSLSPSLGFQEDKMLDFDVEKKEKESTLIKMTKSSSLKKKSRLSTFSGNITKQRYKSKTTTPKFALGVIVLVAALINAGYFAIRVYIFEDFYKNMKLEEIFADVMFPISFCTNEMVTQMLVKTSYVQRSDSYLPLFWPENLESQFENFRDILTELGVKGEPQSNELREHLVAKETSSAFEDHTDTPELTQEDQVYGNSPLVVVFDFLGALKNMQNWLDFLHTATSSYNSQDEEYEISDEFYDIVTYNYWEALELINEMKSEAFTQIRSDLKVIDVLNIFINMLSWFFIILTSMGTGYIYFLIYNEIDGCLMLLTKLERRSLEKFSGKYMKSAILFQEISEDDENRGRLVVFSEPNSEMGSFASIKAEREPKSNEGKSKKAETSLLLSKKQSKSTRSRFSDSHAKSSFVKQNAKKRKKGHSEIRSKSSHNYVNFKTIKRPSFLMILVLLVSISLFLMIAPITNFISSLVFTRELQDSSEWILDTTDLTIKIFSLQLAGSFRVLGSNSTLVETSSQSEIDSFSEFFDSVSGKTESFLSSLNGNESPDSFRGIAYSLLTDNFCNQIPDLADEDGDYCSEITESMVSEGILVSTSTLYLQMVNRLTEVDAAGDQRDSEYLREILKNSNWAEEKRLSYYVTLAWEYFNSLYNEDNKSRINVHQIFQSTNIIIFVIGIIVYLFVFWLKVSFKKEAYISACQDILLIFPCEILSKNNYIKNYFKTKFIE